MFYDTDCLKLTSSLMLTEILMSITMQILRQSTMIRELLFWEKSISLERQVTNYSSSVESTSQVRVLETEEENGVH
jgi:hypothetical protein